MRSRDPINVGGEHFSSMEALGRRAQEILRRGYGEVVGPDAIFLLALFARHRSAEEKRGGGIAHIRIVTMLPFKNLGFQIEHLDGSRTDISYLECLKPSTPSQWFRRACRTAVVAQIQAVKKRAFADVAQIACQVTGEPITQDTCHVHHEAPWEFETIVTSFLAAFSVDVATVQYTGGDGHTQSSFVDVSLSQRFADFHLARASLCVVSALANTSVLRRGQR